MDDKTRALEWLDHQVRNGSVVHAEAIKALIETQAARIEELERKMAMAGMEKMEVE